MKRNCIIIAAFAALALSDQARAVDLTIESKTVNAGSTTSLNVVWSSTTPLNYLSTEFIITTVGSAPSGQVTYTNTGGIPPVPPLSDTNYVFYNDSDDLINLSTSNPASVLQTNWAADSYNFVDSTASGNDYAQNGSRLWTILNLNISSLASGSYQITLGSSSYTNAANPTLPGLTPTMTGGLITVTAVPEPSTVVMVAIATGAVAILARRRKSRLA
jgi:hypothetical protein